MSHQAIYIHMFICIYIYIFIVHHDMHTLVNTKQIHIVKLRLHSPYIKAACA